MAPGLAGGLLTAGQQRADHDHIAAGGDGLHNVAGELHAAVGDDGHAVLGGHPGGVVDGGDLGHADAGLHAGGAEGAGADAHLHAVGARLDEGAGALGGGHITGDQLHVGVEGLDALDGLQHVLGVAVGGVQAQHVHAGLHQGGHPVQHVGGGADGGAHQQAALLVTGGVGVHLGLLDVLDGDEALQTEVLVHDGQLLDLVLAEDLLGLGQGGALGGGDQVFLGHHVVDELVHVGLELHVADGHAGDAELGHQLVRLGQGVAGSQPEGVGDDPVLGALHHVHLFGLLADRHIFMDDANAALPGDGDGHAVLGDGIHGGADQGDIQPDLLRQLGVQVHVGGQHVAGRWDQQHIVKGEALLDELLGGVLIDHKLQLLFLLRPAGAAGPVITKMCIGYSIVPCCHKGCQGSTSPKISAASKRDLPPSSIPWTKWVPSCSLVQRSSSSPGRHSAR